MGLNLKNLEKLARGLMTVPENQFEMAWYQEVIDGDSFLQHHPKLARKDMEALILEDPTELEKYEGGDLESLDPHFVIQHNCGTSGCALGWSPALVKRGRKGEGWDDYSERVFGVNSDAGVWDYMFGTCWRGEQNTPKATAGRIMYVIQNGAPPDNWTYSSEVIYPEFEDVR